MPITSFKTAPAQYSMFAAYRPVIIEPNWNTLTEPYPAVVYCDVYRKNPLTGLNVLIRTLTSTSYTIGTLPYWTFDIQDAIQEFVRSIPLAFSGNNIAASLNDATGANPSFVECTCYFRYGTIDENGFIQPNAEPNPSSGVGPSGFYVLNSTLQHEEIQNLQNHLEGYRKTPFDVAGKRPLPLTHRPDGYIIGRYDWDHSPLFYQPIDSVSNTSVLLLIRYRLEGDSFNTWRSAATTPSQFLVAGFPNEIPSGIAQLSTIAWNNYAVPPGTFIPTTIEWNRLIEYYLQVCRIDESLIPVFTTPKFKVSDCENRIRVRFQNDLGYFDCANFEKYEVTTKSTSSSWQKQLIYPLNQIDGGSKRFNIRSNENYKAVSYCYTEDMLPWLRELFDTPLAWVEVTVQDGSLKNIPITIQDTDFVQKKLDGRFQYETVLQFEMANENIRQRN